MSWHVFVDESKRAEYLLAAVGEWRSRVRDLVGSVVDFQTAHDPSATTVRKGLGSTSRSSAQRAGHA